MEHLAPEVRLLAWAARLLVLEVHRLVLEVRLLAWEVHLPVRVALRQAAAVVPQASSRKRQEFVVVRAPAALEC